MLHGFSRADTPKAEPYLEKMDKGFDDSQIDWRLQDVDIEEWTSPSDRQKEVFFRNGMSFFKDFIQPPTQPFRPTKILGLMVRGSEMMLFMSYMDNYPLMVGKTLGKTGEGKASLFARTTTHSVLAIARILGNICGCQFWWKEYTPEDLVEVCQAMEPKRGKILL
ncbi:MAG: hypothetical protein MMC33_004502 [Icmadophila ericetorum]|nr:hypothetical protein [Icmadophila ericetorum]